MLSENLEQHASLNPSSEQFNILVVDHDVKTSDRLAVRVLDPRGYRVEIARTGREALSRIRRVTPDLVMLEWHMPDMKGEELVQTLIDSGRRFPLIVMGDASSEQTIIQAFRMGAVDYLCKPLDADETIQAIRRALTNRWGERQQTHQVGVLRQQLQRWIAFIEMCRSIFSILRPDELLTQLVDAAILVSGSEEGFALLAHPETDVLELRAMRGLDEETTKLVRLVTGDSSARMVYDSGMPLRLGQDDASEHKVRTGYLVKGLVHVPIRFGQRVIGVLSVDRKISSEPFSAEDEAMLVQLAGCAAVTLENITRYREAYRTRNRLSERAKKQLVRLEEQISQLANTISEPDEIQLTLVKEIHQMVDESDQLLQSSNGQPN